MFTIMVAGDEDDTFEMDHSEAIDFLDNLDVCGLEACRDAIDFTHATYMSPQYGPIFIEFHTDSRI